MIIRLCDKNVICKTDDLISGNGKIADIFNDFLTITVSGDILCEASNIKNPVLKAIEKYKKHPSVKAIAGIYKNNNFILEKVSYKDILHEIKQLGTRKASQECLKNANITPVFKKGLGNSETKYRPVTIPPNISKIYERRC